MSRVYEERETPTAKISVLTEVSCDRCGADAKCQNASADTGGHTSGPWGAIRALITGGAKAQLDLCRDCSSELLDWIDSKRCQQGFGPVPGRATTATPESDWKFVETPDGPRPPELT